MLYCTNNKRTYVTTHKNTRNVQHIKQTRYHLLDNTIQYMSSNSILGIVLLGS